MRTHIYLVAVLLAVVPAFARLPTNRFVRPGVTADRVARRVVVAAEATGIGAREIAEFFLVTRESGHDYEAIAVSAARPSDIYKALEFIGLPPGRAVDRDAHCFWPKGERVTATFRALPEGSGPGAVRAEELILDTQTGRTLPSAGLVFVGGPVRVIDPDSGKRSFAVDVLSPGSIAANYNEPITVLDVPRWAPQGAVYSQQTVNPAYVFEKGRRLEIVLEPELGAGRRRVADVDLGLDMSGGAVNGTRPVYTLRHDDVETRTTNATDVLRAFSTMVDNDRDPFVALRVGDAVPLGTLREICRLLASIESDRGIRMEPPPAGNFYFKAFIPDPSLGARDTRLMQPWELRLAVNAAGALQAVMVRIDEEWRDDRPRPVLHPQPHPVADPAAARALLDADPEGLPVLLVYAPPTLTHGVLMSWLRPAVTTHPTVHVFLDDSHE